VTNHSSQRKLVVHMRRFNDLYYTNSCIIVLSVFVVVLAVIALVEQKRVRDLEHKVAHLQVSVYCAADGLARIAALAAERGWLDDVGQSE